jgi:hypothetical protein
MSRLIKIITKEFEVEAELLPERPKTCEGIWKALPLEAEVEIWKEEVYFDIPVRLPPEAPTPKTTAGDVAYWPDGPGFCIFFGKSQPVSPVNTFARIAEGVEKFKKMKSGDWIKIERG